MDAVSRDGPEDTGNHRKMRDMFENTNRSLKQFHKQVGSITNRIEEIVGHLMAPKLHKQFRSLGYNFRNTAQDCELYDTTGQHVVAKADVFLENGEYALTVEVKTKSSQEDVDEHVKRLEVLRSWAEQRRDGRKFLGAMAGAVIQEEVNRLPAPWSLRCGKGKSPSSYE